MKKYILVIILAIAIQLAAAQAPQSFNYQCVVRNSLGQIAVNKLVSFRISILKSSATGNAVYAETHNKVTNEFGLATLEIGGGAILSGNFTTINWGDDIYFLKTEFDYNGGSNYIFMGTSQLLSVPYALYAEKAGNVEDDHDKDSTNEIQTISKNDSTVTLSNNGGSFIDSDNQTIAIIGNQLTISNGNSVLFTGAVDLDADPTNELQNLNLHNDTLNISQGNAVVFAHDNDRDSTNEIQTLSVNNNVLNLSKANSVNIDADTTNELQSLSVGNNVLSISKGNSVNIDSDTLNEIQTITLSGDTIKLNKNGGSIVLSFEDQIFASYLQYKGSGKDGDFISNGNASISGIKNYKNFTLNYGDTLSVDKTVLIRVQDTCIINGVIDGYGKITDGTTGMGGSGGGGGGLQLNPSISWFTNGAGGIASIFSAPLSSNYQIPGGLPGTTDTIGYNGGNGVFPDSLLVSDILESNNFPRLNGTAGGEGGVYNWTPCVNTNGQGGNGGAGIYIICTYFYFDGIIDLRGTNGTDGTICTHTGSNSLNGTTASAGGGGGGGGSCIISANLLMLFNGNIYQSCGFAGNGSTNGSVYFSSNSTTYTTVGKNGGNGGAGWYKIILR